ncbi:hypothetical protein GLAREA_07329 [Glarea lozoyensis ATCC 20868]|uniref:Uncharacterized protein n=1 Tax=Glarea lozoyensis (strain ATCC 20868 / MF5171) TaxID=1116229 RepID=S3DJI1_GLAL2|nr:uncharacterized protein GLAREA_07329 [Glarea lozoyensis ATCC 20868]EPE32196.1 hypothetical protein GLAREA_07329 [Glarea lozoyensis ATCC 20868]
MAAYNALEQVDHDDSDKDPHSNNSSPAHDHSHRPLASPVFAPPRTALKSLFLDAPDTSYIHEEGNSPSPNGLSQMVQSLSDQSRGDTNTSGSYDMVENDDFADDAPNSPAFSFEKILASAPASGSSSPQTRAPLPPVNISRPLPRVRPLPATAADFANPQPSKTTSPIVRTASGRKPALRHPTPDLQVLQGAYVGNIEHLERTAERLSMTSSIDLAIKELHDEQKRSDSRRSSLGSVPEMAGISRQMSNASSIVEVNSAARSGGYSPGGFMMSPKGSITAAGRMRSASKSSRFGSRPEPEMEGRPLDSLMSSAPSYVPTSPVLDRSISIEEQDEESTTLTRPVVDQFNHAERVDHPQPYEQRPVTATSTYTSNEQAMFEGFDGDHTDYLPQEPLPLPPPPKAPIHNFHAHFDFEDVPQETEEQESQVPSPEPPLHSRSMSSNDLLMPATQRRVSSGNRLSMARPQSYADPSTGQQMVYYPAPVPMMLNLPQKLSKNPSAMARNKRRSQVMSNIPAAARQSAIWLPDVLEDEPHLVGDEGVQSQEYLPQHQRATMGGRRHTQDLTHLPPQLRASTFFDLQAPPQTVEMKEQSAVATLDSILDASAHAPVSAFTDHAFAGHLGAEVYGKPKHDRHRSSTQLLDHPQKKRSSSFNLLKGRRASSQTLLLDTEKEKKRSSRMSDLGLAPKPRMTLDDDDEDELARDRLPGDEVDGDAAIRPDSGEFGEDGEEVVDEEEEEDGEEDDEQYHGPPTTLLAELQLRKQQQKLRTRNLGQAYPNGMHSTLLQMDAVAQVEQKSRKQKRVNLAWEAPVQKQDDNDGSDDDVPLAILYSKKAQDLNRPIGLLERREMEDNEPLSKRRERITGRPAVPRAVTNPNLIQTEEPEEEGETLAQRIKRLKDKEAGVNDLGLPKARPISGDFASEMMSQFGGDLATKPKAKEAAPPPEDETLGQRRKRLQAEREAAAANGDSRPGLNKRHSMATILQAHPSAGATTHSQSKPSTGLLGLHEQSRSSSQLRLDTTPRQSSGGYKNGPQGGIVPPQNPYPNMYAPPQFAQPTLPAFNGAMMGNNMFYNPYAGMAYQGFMPNPMLHMQQMSEPLNQGQIDMVERWRQSVMQ